MYEFFVVCPGSKSILFFPGKREPDDFDKEVLEPILSTTTTISGFQEVLTEWFLCRHKLYEHGIEEGALFCPICPKSKVVFFKKQNLNRHLKVKHKLQTVD